MRPATLAVALGVTFAVSTAAAEPCKDDAQSILRRAESAGMSARAGIILDALQKSAPLGCDVVPAEHWQNPPALPEACTLAALDVCDDLGTLPVAAQVARDVDPDLFVRVQTAAKKLRDAGRLGRSAKRLLQLLLLSDAVRRGH